MKARVLYTMANVGMYVELVRLRYAGPRYNKYDVAYYTKPCKTLMCVERNVKIYHHVREMWDKEPQ